MNLIFDMGGTKTRFALTENGKLDEIVRMDTDPSSGGFAALLGAMEEYLDGRRVTSVIGGMPGQLTGDEGSLSLAPNLPKWLGMPVRSMIERQFDCKAEIYNDVVLGGIGEANYGAGITDGVMAYFTISTGVNGVRLINGNVDETIGRYELGHTLLEESAGKLNSLESKVGGAALTKASGKHPRDVRDPSVWRDRAHFLAVGLYNTCLYWAPEVIVLGGSMMRDIDLDEVSAQMATLPNVVEELPQLSKSKLGDTNGIHGALAILKSNK